MTPKPTRFRHEGKPQKQNESIRGCRLTTHRHCFTLVHWLRGDCVRINQSLTILGCLLITGCALLKPELPLDTISLPPTYSTPALAESTVAETAWWLTFNNPELDELIDHAIIHNPSLEQVWARLTQADATARRLGAARLPSINLTSGFTRTEADQHRRPRAINGAEEPQ